MDASATTRAVSSIARQDALPQSFPPGGLTRPGRAAQAPVEQADTADHLQREDALARNRLPFSWGERAVETAAVTTYLVLGPGTMILGATTLGCIGPLAGVSVPCVAPAYSTLVTGGVPMMFGTAVTASPCCLAQANHVPATPAQPPATPAQPPARAPLQAPAQQTMRQLTPIVRVVHQVNHPDDDIQLGVLLIPEPEQAAPQHPGMTRN